MCSLNTDVFRWPACSSFTFANAAANGKRRSYQIHHAQEVPVVRIKAAVARFVREEDGAALAEYGILVAFIAAIAIIGVQIFGNKISAKFSEINAKFT